MNRVTIKQLKSVADMLNRMTGNPLEHYAKNDAGEWRANVGNFHISQAYGGYCLHQMCNESGGVRDIFSCGHVPARELFGLMHAFRRGLEFNQA